jgi:hypothetical protein
MHDSWTDVVSNEVSLRGLRLEDDIQLVLSNRHLPLESLGPFLHEACHHWCARSALGTTLATLRLRVERTLCSSAVRLDLEAVARDYTAYRVATELLRPLSEGMAAFQEFDAWTETSIGLSSPWIWAHGMYVPQESLEMLAGQGRAIVDLPVRWLMRRLRSSVLTIDRKANLLAQPLSANAGGYLPGYLAVKSLWVSACKMRPSIAADSDMFLAYLRAYLYEDCVLARDLLDDGIPTSDIPGSVAERFDRRLSELPAVLAANAELFERLSYGYKLNSDDSRDPRSDEQIAIGLQVEESEGALRVLDIAFKELEEVPDDLMPGPSAGRTLYGRSLFRLIGGPAFVGISSRGEVQVWSKPSRVLLLQSRPDPARKEAEIASGSVEVCFDTVTSGRERALIVEREGAVVLVVTSAADESSGLRRRVERWNLSRQAGANAKEVMRMTTPRLESMPLVREAILQARTLAHELCSASPTSLLNRLVGRNPLDESGYLDVSTEGLRAIACAGLIASCGHTTEEFEAEMDRLGLLEPDSPLFTAKGRHAGLLPGIVSVGDRQILVP